MSPNENKDDRLGHFSDPVLGSQSSSGLPPLTLDSEHGDTATYSSFVTGGCGVASLPNGWFKAPPSALNWGGGEGLYVSFLLSLDYGCDNV